MQRWSSWCKDPKREDDNGPWVRYADHVAALAEQRDRLWAEWWATFGASRYSDGYEAGLEAAAAGGDAA